MKRELNDYLKTLLLAKEQGANERTGKRRSAEIQGMLEINEDGYLVAPRTQSWGKVTKADLEPIYRMYITQHYRVFPYLALMGGLDTLIGLACRDVRRQAPFERITIDPSLFIDAEYMPDDVQLSDPRSMKLDAIIRFFEHIADREVIHGIRNAFRFKAVLSSHKKGVIQMARYRHDDTRLAVDTTSVGRSRKNRSINSKGSSQSSGQQAVSTGIPTPTSSPPTRNVSAQNMMAPDPAANTLKCQSRENMPAHVRLALRPSRQLQSENTSAHPTSSERGLYQTGMYTPEITPTPPVMKSPDNENVTYGMVKSFNAKALVEGPKTRAKSKRIG